MGRGTSSYRTKNYSLQVKGSILFRAIGIGSTFISMPLTIHYLGEAKFGVWTTLLSILTWVIFFDFGVGHGLKNEVAESLAKNDFLGIKKSISAAYSAIGIITLTILFLFLTLSFFIPWQEIFNTTEIQEDALRNAVQITATFILVNFWFGLVNSLLSAFQKTSIITLNQTISSVLSLIFVYILLQTTSGSLWKLAVAYGCALSIPNIISTLSLYFRYPKLRPKFSIEIKHWKSLLSVGSQFLIIQLAVMVIFLTDKILITQIFGPEFVTQYEVIFKVFSVITLACSIISTPLWSAYTDAHFKADYSWIVKMLRRQLYAYTGVIFSTIFICLIIRQIIQIWIGTDLEVSMNLVYSMAIFILISTWNNIFATLVNGIGRIRLQLYTSIVAMVVNVPLALLFTKHYNFGVSGVVLATCMSLFFAAVMLPLQVRMIFREYSNAV